MSFYALSALINAIVSTVLGIFVFSRNRKDIRYITHSLFCLSVAVWSYFYFVWQITSDENLALFSCRGLMAGAIFIPVCYLHHLFTFFDIYARKKKLILYGYSVGLLFLILDFTPLFVKDVSPKLIFKFWPNPGVAYHPFLIIWAWYVIYGISVVIGEYKKSSGFKKNQLKYVLLATFIGWSGGATNYPLWYNIPVFPFGNILVSGYMVIVAYAILRHRLMDIRVALTRAGIFIAVYTLVLGLPFVLVFWLRSWLTSVFGGFWWFAPMGLLFLLATIGPFIYIYIDRRAEERLFKELKAQRGYKKDLEGASKTMILVHEPQTLIKMIARAIMQKVKVKHAGILLHDKDKDTYVLTVSRGPSGLKIPEGFARMDKDNPLIRFFMEGLDKELLGGSALVYEEAEKILVSPNLAADKNEILKGALYQMEIFDSQVSIPSFFRDELVGILLLGSKVNEEKFAEDELNFFIALTSDVAMAIRNARLFKDLELELDKNKRLFLHTTIALAAAIDAKDHYTHGHTSRVTSLSLLIAENLKQKNRTVFSEKFLEHLHIAALLHDIGKIGIPESILNKQGPLNEEEKKQMQAHPVVGETILKPIKELEDAILGVRYHHEKYDGTGYPEGLKGDQIPLIAAIISVADTFDAMTTDRPYRPGLLKDAAAGEIKLQSGGQFNPLIVDAFIELFQAGKIS